MASCRGFTVLPSRLSSKPQLATAQKSFKLKLPTPLTPLSPVSVSRGNPLAVTANTLSAATGLIASSLVGTISERTILPPNSGILGTLIASAILSNLKWVPATHALYDLCWSLFLPASLALLLLEEPPPSSSKASSPDLQKVGLAFLVASLASLAGCTASFLVCRSFPTLWLAPKDAAVAGGCLCASYVGGSINFFATARIMGTGTSLLSSMAAADLMTMALYFAWLATALQNKRLLKLFGERPQEPSVVVVVAADDMETKEKTSISMKISATLLVSLLAWAMATFANRLEQLLTPIISGTTCAIIAVLGTTLQKVMRPYRSNTKLWRSMQRAATPLASLSFQIFFAAIGISANLGQALQTGPASLFFSGTALLLHIGLTLGGCLAVNAIFGNANLKLSHVLVASNAAIGGPATAAAYAGQQRTGLTLAATVWGVVGYGIGTNLGIAMSRLYQACL
jgi:uncharacterized membrane protein